MSKCRSVCHQILWNSIPARPSPRYWLVVPVVVIHQPQRVVDVFAAEPKWVDFSDIERREGGIGGCVGQRAERGVLVVGGNAARAMLARRDSRPSRISRYFHCRAYIVPFGLSAVNVEWPAGVYPFFDSSRQGCLPFAVSGTKSAAPSLRFSV